MPHIYDDFRTVATRIPGTVAVEYCHRAGIDQVTFGELARLAEGAARTLAGLGVGAGDRCAILAENHYRWFVAYLAILRLGAVAVPLDTAYSAAQVRTVLGDSDAKVVVASPRYLGAAREAAAARSPAGRVRPRRSGASALRRWR
jgi:long-subunit acyl-CoA synthetase (AMP-forming)